jgi:ketosteroid isomerase-like protein
MLTAQVTREFADRWIAAWNAHDLDAILSHYASTVTLTSPVAASLLNDPSGTVRGKEALRVYFQSGLEAFPNLKFTLHDVLWGLSTIVLYYTNHKGTKTAEFMELDSDGKVIRVVANYSA